MLNKDKKVIIHGIFRPEFFDSIKKKNIKEVVVLEGRPTLDSLKDSCRQLLKRKITPVVVSDNMAGYFFYNNLVKEAFLSYQVSDAEGALCLTGGLILGVLAKRHRVPVSCYPSLKKTKILGNKKDINCFNGIRVAMRDIKVYVPLVEWVPAKYIRKINE